MIFQRFYCEYCPICGETKGHFALVGETNLERMMIANATKVEWEGEARIDKDRIRAVRPHFVFDPTNLFFRRN
jgi:hypothetical protein